MGAGYRNHSVSVLLSFRLSPGGEVFQIPVSVRTALQDLGESVSSGGVSSLCTTTNRLCAEVSVCVCSAAVPFLEGECMERGVRILVHYGSLQGEMTVYVGGLKLDQQLLQDGRYTVDINKEVMTIEIPLYAPGMDYRVHVILYKALN